MSDCQPMGNKSVETCENQSRSDNGHEDEEMGHEMLSK